MTNDFWIIDNTKYSVTHLSIPSPKINHSMLNINDEYILIIGGNDTKTYLFNISKKEFIFFGDTNEIHLNPTLLIYNKYMVIYSGLNDKEEIINDLFLFDFNDKKWIECDLINANLTEKRDGQSCCLVGDTMYLFGGQGPEEDKYSNKLFTITFSFNSSCKVIII